MGADSSKKVVSLSYVKAETRSDAVRKMILADPLLSQLYDTGSSNDGKAGWVNAIKDQHGGAYRLLFYINKLRLAEEFSDREPYEVLYGEIGGPDAPPNFPRALFTTTGAINLMRDGVPSERFVLDLLRSALQIVPWETGRDIHVKNLLKQGYAYICVYDRDGEGIRVLDLNEYFEIFNTPDLNEIQVHSSEVVVIGDTKFVRPFLIRYAPGPMDEQADSAADAASALLGRPKS